MSDYDFKENFVHDLTNKLMSMDGKIKKLSIMIDDNLKDDLEKLEAYCKEAGDLVKSFKKHLEAQED